MSKRTLQEFSVPTQSKRRRQEERFDEEGSQAEEVPDEQVEEDLDDEGAPDITDVTRAKGSTEAAQKIILALQLEPNDPETREMAKLYIRKMFIDNGGLPFNSKDPIPHDLDKLNSTELGFVIENMIIHTARTKQAEIISQATNVFSNISYFFTGEEKLVTQINSDSTLRQALLDTFVGVRISPVLSLLISASSHISNLLRSYVENGKRQQPTKTGEAKTTGQTTASSSSSIGASSYESGFPKPPER